MPRVSGGSKFETKRVKMPYIRSDKKAGGLGRSSPGSIDSYPRFRQNGPCLPAGNRHQKAAALALSSIPIHTNSYLPLLEPHPTPPRHIWNLQVRKLLAIDSSSPLLRGARLLGNFILDFRPLKLLISEKKKKTTPPIHRLSNGSKLLGFVAASALADVS